MATQLDNNNEYQCVIIIISGCFINNNNNNNNTSIAPDFRIQNVFSSLVYCALCFVLPCSVHCLFQCNECKILNALCTLSKETTIIIWSINILCSTFFVFHMFYVFLVPGIQFPYVLFIIV